MTTERWEKRVCDRENAANAANGETFSRNVWLALDSVREILVCCMPPFNPHPFKPHSHECDFVEQAFIFYCCCSCYKLYWDLSAFDVNTLRPLRHVRKCYRTSFILLSIIFIELFNLLAFYFLRSFNGASFYFNEIEKPFFLDVCLPVCSFICKLSLWGLKDNF